MHADEGISDFACVQLFVYNKANIDAHATTAMQALKPGGLLWFAYPKKSSKVKTDISRDIIWEGLMSIGIHPVTLISIDDTWSALRFRPSTLVTGKAGKERT